MAIFNKSIMTAEGMTLLTDILSGDGEIEFVSLVTGNGTYSNSEKTVSYIRNMKVLKSEKQSFLFSSVNKTETGQAILKANVINDELTTGYFMTELGVLARKRGTTNTILYSVITVEESDYFPAVSEGQYSIVFSINVKIDDVENVSIVFSRETYALAEDLEKANENIQNLNTKIIEVTAVAKGKNRARVFATTESMNAWLSNPDNAGIAIVGDNLYIVDVGVPDWWIAEVLTEADENGRYYKIEQLEGQKIDLTTYDQKIAAINTELGKKVTTGGQAKLYNVGLGNSDTALIYSEGDDVSFRFKGKNGDTLYTNLKTITGDINVLADRGRGYFEICSLWSENNGATLTKPVDNILGYSYLLFCFIYGNKYYDTKLIPAKLFTEVMKFTGALRLHKANGEDVAAEVWWDGSQICTYINTGSHVVRVYGIA